jgi:large subunit ribosomal protein L4
MDLQVQGGGSVSVSDAISATEFNASLVHQAVVAYMAGGRSGTKAQKNRSAVSGGGAKPWRQKGTGRARAGTTRSPIWRSGGVAFAAQPRNYAQKLNKKMYRAAMRSIVAELIRNDRLVVVSDFRLDAPKTRDMVSALKAHDVSDALVVVDDLDDNLLLASRNLPLVDVVDVSGLNPYVLVRNKTTLITESALKQLDEVLS